MAYDPLFDTEENKSLLAFCTRRLIRNIGVGGIIWGLINIGLGFVAMQETMLNVGLLALGLLMLGTGIQAFRRPSLGVLLSETIVTVLLFAWNLAITILNAQAGGGVDPRGLIFPLIIAGMLAKQYHSLRHMRALIAVIPEAQVAATKEVCKQILKRKPKTDPSIVQSADGKCRLQMMADRAFFVQRDQMRAFTVFRHELAQAVKKLEAPRWSCVFRHPVGTLDYRFDKVNTQKLKTWLAA
jgi:hypothetical protein